MAPWSQSAFIDNFLKSHARIKYYTQQLFQCNSLPVCLPLDQISSGVSHSSGNIALEFDLRPTLLPFITIYV